MHETIRQKQYQETLCFMWRRPAAGRYMLTAASSHDDGDARVDLVRVGPAMVDSASVVLTVDSVTRVDLETMAELATMAELVTMADLVTTAELATTAELVTTAD
jgi:hypothetical protein